MIKVKKLETPFKEVELREPTVKEVIKALDMARDNDFRLGVALLHLCATFDGKKLTMEEIEELPLSFFSELSEKLREFLPKNLERQLSYSQRPQTRA